ncbi:hypothetical protein PG990_006101 [Apiospora arundinis]|uniref:Secreted protein n=1 Tax=Apiospora arundinis TaxID=335852 RepID=A0ABR2J9X4_9PEZI
MFGPATFCIIIIVASITTILDGHVAASPDRPLYPDETRTMSRWTRYKIMIPNTPVKLSRSNGQSIYSLWRRIIVVIQSQN